MNVPRLISIAAAVAIHAAAIAVIVNRTGPYEFSESGLGSSDLTVVATVTLDDGELFAGDTVNAQAREAAVASQRAELPPPTPRDTARPQAVTAQKEAELEAAEPLPVQAEPPVKKPETHVPETKREPEKTVDTQAAEAASKAAEAEEERRAAAQSEARRGRLTSVYGNGISISLGRAKVNPHTKQTGRVLLEFTIAPSGELMTRAVVQSSGADALDRAALASLEKAAPFPPIPADLGTAPLTLRVPFEYTAR